MSLWDATASRKIVERIVVEATLILETPAHFGNGDAMTDQDADDVTDMPLLMDAIERRPLLTGASLAGALRAAMREREHGYGMPQEKTSASVQLFGGIKGDDEGAQSALIVDDSLGTAAGIEIRDGVALDPNSRTARDKGLFNLQAWEAGTSFQIRLELLVQADNRDALVGAFLNALEELNSGSITLGARKRRGYGRFRVENWRYKRYDFGAASGLLDWISNGGQELPESCTVPGPAIIREGLKVEAVIPDNRRALTIDAEFDIDGAILIRSGGVGDSPDMVHLHARQSNGQISPVVSGTSLGGALRARASKILRTLWRDEKETEKFINGLFGGETGNTKQKLRASRVTIKETLVENAETGLVQNRVSIDRFTGGARDTALFNEQPAFGGRVKVSIHVRNPGDPDIGIFLLLLKDLWTSDLPIGGESSVGRGRLKGRNATVTVGQGNNTETWKIESDEKKIRLDGSREELEKFVSTIASIRDQEAA